MARRVLSNLDEALEDLTNLKELRRGLVRVAAPERKAHVTDDDLGQIEAVCLELRGSFAHLEHGSASLDHLGHGGHRVVEERPSGLPRIDVVKGPQRASGSHQGRVLRPDGARLVVEVGKALGCRQGSDRLLEQRGDRLWGQLVAHRRSGLLI